MKTLEDVRAKIDNEGFDYALRNWDFKEVQDKKFHKLRLKYVFLADELDEYIGCEEVYGS